MRTTLTLDDDVAALLAREVERRKTGLKDVVNDALRAGLSRPRARRPKRFRTRTVDLGTPRAALDNVWEAIAAAEGDGYR
jgi:hypothetical protein